MNQLIQMTLLPISLHSCYWHSMARGRSKSSQARSISKTKRKRCTSCHLLLTRVLVLLLATSGWWLLELSDHRCTISVVVRRPWLPVLKRSTAPFVGVYHKRNNWSFDYFFFIYTCTSTVTENIHRSSLASTTDLLSILTSFIYLSVFMFHFIFMCTL